MFKKIAALTAPSALLLCLAACGPSGPMSSKDTCSNFNSIVSSVSSKSSDEDSKKAAGQLEDLSDKAPDSLKQRITATAKSLRDNTGPGLSPYMKSLDRAAVDLSISEFKDICTSKS